MKKTIAFVLSAVIAITCTSISVFADTQKSVNGDSIAIDYLDELLSMASNAEQNGVLTEIPELKDKSTLNEYDLLIIDANKRSNAKFIKVVGIENRRSLEEVEEGINEIIEERKALDAYIERRESQQNNSAYLEQLEKSDEFEISIMSTVTKTITKTDWNSSSFNITAVCTGSNTGTISVSSAKMGTTSFNHVVFSPGQTWSQTSLDAGRTRGVTVNADILNIFLDIISNRNAYAEFYRSEL